VQAAVDLGVWKWPDFRGLADVQTDVSSSDRQHSLLWDVYAVSLLVGHLRKPVQQRKRVRNRTRRHVGGCQEIPADAPNNDTTDKTENIANSSVLPRSLTSRNVVAQTRKARVRMCSAELDIPDSARSATTVNFGQCYPYQSRVVCSKESKFPRGKDSIPSFEVPTDRITRGKVANTAGISGPTVFPSRSAKGLITQYEVLEGNPGD